MEDQRTYCVMRVSNRNGEQMRMARNIDTLAEAGELALRLLYLQEMEFGNGGVFEFIAEPE